MNNFPDLSVVLLHSDMHNKNGDIVTASLTLIDVHDLARSCRTYGAKELYIAHPAETLRRLTNKLQSHWEEGFGATYNPNRKEALEIVKVMSTLDEVTSSIQERTGMAPILLATSAKSGTDRVSFSEMKKELFSNHTQPYLLMLGTGWGMSESLLAKANSFLEPIKTTTNYNHLSVRSACAIMLDRLLGEFIQSANENVRFSLPKANRF